jgi:hypothetical protein
MNGEPKSVTRCAIYTRKSSEEGVSNNPSTPWTLNGKPVRPSSSASARRAGAPFPPSTTMAAIPVEPCSDRPSSVCCKTSKAAKWTPSWSTRSIASPAAWPILPRSWKHSMLVESPSYP